MPLSGVLRHSTRDVWLVALSFVHAGLLLAVPSPPLIAIGLWWNANTISHNFVHLPFFRSRALNRVYAIYLTLLLGIPHSLWRERHLRHHRATAGTGMKPCTTRVAVAQRFSAVFGTTYAEIALIAALWSAMVSTDAVFFATVYLPGYLIGLGLCHVHGHFEHARGTTSHYGRLYNLIFFNDGYHVEHHHRSSEHWTRLPRHVQRQAMRSRWPPVVRWLDSIGLESLERLVLHSTWLQRYVLASHERAFRRLLTAAPGVRRVTIVGGGLFPRTALVLSRVLPSASLTIVDASGSNLEIARRFLRGSIDLRHGMYPEPSSPDGSTDEPDLVVVPLAFMGDRDRLYRDPPARCLLIHDWIWRRRSEGVTISWLLLKRLNLVTR